MEDLLNNPIIIVLTGTILALVIVGVLLFGIASHLMIAEKCLIKQIKEHPEQADELIDNYKHKDFLPDDFYKKYASPSFNFKPELDENIEYADNYGDFVALDTYQKLSSKYNKHLQKQLAEKAKIEADKIKQEQTKKIELLTNKASQALDDIWD